MKNSMKKLLCMMLAGMMALCLIACSEEKKDNKEEGKTEEKVETKADETTAEETVENTEEAEENTEEEEDEETVENTKVAEYVDKYGSVLIDSLTESAGGMVDADIRAEGNTVVIDMAYKTISSSQLAGKEDEMAKMFDEMYGALNLVEMLQQASPEIDALKIIISTNDGKEIYNRTFE